MQALIKLIVALIVLIFIPFFVWMPLLALYLIIILLKRAYSRTERGISLLSEIVIDKIKSEQVHKEPKEKKENAFSTWWNKKI